MRAVDNGGNPGTPTEAGLYADAEAALDFLARQRIPANRLVLYGESLGSGVAVHMAAGRAIAALILEAPFTRLADAASYHYPYVPVWLLRRDRFDSISAIGKVGAPMVRMVLTAAAGGVAAALVAAVVPGGGRAAAAVAVVAGGLAVLAVHGGGQWLLGAPELRDLRLRARRATA